MDQNSSIQSIWLILLICGFVYLSDYYLTIAFAKYYKEYMHLYVSYEGSIELTPQFQNDVAELRLLSPQFVVRWLISLALIYIMWWLSVVYSKQPLIFHFILGAFLLREVVVHLRHIRNLSLYLIAKSGGLKGKLEYSRWSVLKQSAVELLSFSLMFLLLAMLLKSWFFGGGSIGCMITGIQHWKMFKNALAMSQTTQGEIQNA